MDKEFHFNFDPCPVNPTFDGLSIPWKESNFVNPPYGREIPKWVEKAWYERERGNLVVMLIPSRTDTKWWHDFIMKADEIRFIRGRIKFLDASTGKEGNSAPFPSAIIVFRGKAIHL